MDDRKPRLFWLDVNAYSVHGTEYRRVPVMGARPRMDNKLCPNDLWSFAPKTTLAREQRGSANH